MRSRRLCEVLTIALIALLLPLPQAQGATQLASKVLSFDDWTWYTYTPDPSKDSWQQSHDDTYHKQATYYFTTTVPAYFSFLYVKVSHKFYDGSDAYIERRIMIKAYLDGNDVTSTLQGNVVDGVFHDRTEEFFISLPNTALASNLTVEIWTSTGDVVNSTASPIVTYTVESIKVLFSPTEGGFTYSTRNVNNIQIPAGAGNSTKSLLLDKTQLMLSNELLDQGSVTFYVNWDGTAINITNFLEVDSSGKLYVIGENNGQFTQYTTTLSLSQGVWQRIYISWKAGELYVMLDGKDKVNTFKFAGGIRIGQIGSVTVSSSTKIDEFAYWKVYMSPDEFLASVQGLSRYGVTVGDLSLSIVAEGGTSLSPLKVSFLDANKQPLGDVVQISPTNPTINAPTETAYIVIESSTPQVQRIYYISGLVGSVSLAFPSSDVSELIPITVTVPAGYTTLSVYTADGANALVFRTPIEGDTATFVAVYGHYYRFELTGPNMSTVSVIQQASRQLISLKSEDLPKAVTLATAEEKLEAKYDLETGLIYAAYSNPHDTDATITITFYDANNTAIRNLTVTIKPNEVWIWNAPMPPGVAYVVFTADSGEYHASKTVQGTLSPPGWINEKLLPMGLIMILVATAGVFATNRENSAYAVIIMLVLLSLAAYIGLVQFSASLFGLLIVLATLGMYVSREG